VHKARDAHHQVVGQHSTFVADAFRLQSLAVTVNRLENDIGLLLLANIPRGVGGDTVGVCVHRMFVCDNAFTNKKNQHGQIQSG
jgi:DNA polymerase III delta prime subunit